MAIWQFNIYFIPRQSLFEKYGQVLTNIDFENALTDHWWTNLDLKLNKILPLLQQFGDLQEWSARTEGLRIYGDTEANDISVCFNSKTKKVEELSCRIDLRQIDKNVIDKVFSIATQFDCLLMSNKGKLFQPTIAAFIDSVQDSNAKRFLSDQMQFLDNLSKEVETPDGIR